MTHPTLEQLLELREPGAEPGEAAVRAHVDRCEACQAEVRRLDQLTARMRALSPLRPTHDVWPTVRARHGVDRRRRLLRRFSVTGLAAAAVLAGVIELAGVPGRSAAPAADTQQAITAAQARSQVLEQALHQYDPSDHIVDGRTDRIAEALEDQIAAVDRQLQAADLLPDQDRPAASLQLWRERVGLLDALVDVHVTHASNVGL